MISLILITTNYRYRFPYLLKTLESYSKFIDRFDEFIISVDFFENKDGISKVEFINNLSKFLFINNILFKNPCGMISNQLNAFKHCKGDIIIYSEDDIYIKNIPERNTIEKICESGVIVYNIHYLHNKNIREKEFSNKDNYEIVNNDYFFKKNRNIADEYYIAFPLAIMKRDIFIDSYKYMKGKLENIEVGFSKTIRQLDKYKSFNVYIYIEPICYGYKYLVAQMTYRDNNDELNNKAYTIKTINNYSLFSIFNEDVSNI